MTEYLDNAQVEYEREMVKITWTMGDQEYGFVTSKKMLVAMQDRGRLPVVMEMKVFDNE